MIIEIVARPGTVRAAAAAVNISGAAASSSSSYSTTSDPIILDQAKEVVNKLSPAQLAAVKQLILQAEAQEATKATAASATQRGQKQPSKQSEATKQALKQKERESFKKARIDIAEKRSEFLSEAERLRPRGKPLPEKLRALIIFNLNQKLIAKTRGGGFADSVRLQGGWLKDYSNPDLDNTHKAPPGFIQGVPYSPPAEGVIEEEETEEESEEEAQAEETRSQLLVDLTKSK